MGNGRVNRGQLRRAHLFETAEERRAEREKRTPQQQLEVLDQRLGLGVGATKERARLAREIESKTKSKVKSTEKRSERGRERAKDRRKRERAGDQ